MALSRSIEWAAERFEDRCLAPLHAALRKRRRFQGFGIDKMTNLPVAPIDVQPRTLDCVAACASQIHEELMVLDNFLDDRSFFWQRWRPTASVIDLAAYPNFARYADGVRRHSKGGILRQVRRARDAGFYCEVIAHEAYARQHIEIEISKKFRQGPVIKAFLGRAPASEPDEVIAPSAPPCPHHWNVEWGVLQSQSTSGSGTKRLVGFVLLRRTGNVLRTILVSGHGAYLPKHVMKLLFHDVMQWLLSHHDPLVRGIHYFVYGAIEHGNDGLLAWKRSFGFAPYRLQWVGIPSQSASPPCPSKMGMIEIARQIEIGAGVESLEGAWRFKPTGAPGHVLFGPYVGLAHGRYMATIELDAVLNEPSDFRPSLSFDIYDGERILGQKMLEPRSRGGRRAEIQFIVSPAYEDRRYEMRLWSSGSVSGLVTHLSLSRIGDWDCDAPSLSQRRGLG